MDRSFTLIAVENRFSAAATFAPQNSAKMIEQLVNMGLIIT